MTAAPSVSEARRRDTRRWVLVPLRLVVGFGFAAHGYAKLARGPAGFATILAAMGIPAPLPMAWTTSVLELLGGAALMLGAFVAPLSVPLGVVMLTAMVGVHLPYGFSSVRLQSLTAAGAMFGPVGYELNLLYLAALLALALGGASPLSIDRWREQRGPRPPRAARSDRPSRTMRSERQADAADLKEAERGPVETALQDARYNTSDAARALGLTRKQLYVRLRRFGLD